MTHSSPDVADALRELSRQVRWQRHAIQRLLAVARPDVRRGYRRYRGETPVVGRWIMQLISIWIAIWHHRLARYCFRTARSFGDFGMRLHRL